MSKIAVTGAGGQLGRELCRQHRSVVGLSREALPLTDAGAVRRRLETLRPRVLINAAAFTQVDAAESDPVACRAVNVRGVRHLAEVCRDIDCALVQISTDYVFAGSTSRGRPFREDDPPAPQGVYATTKFEAERIAAELPSHLIVRTCGLYASGDHAEAGNFVNTILRLARDGRHLRIVNDQMCTPSFVPHVAEAVLFLVDAAIGGNAPWGTYHVANSGETTWYQFAKELCRQAAVEATLEPISSEAYGAAAPRPAYSVLDTTKYREAGGPELPSWQQGLADRLSV